MRSRLILFIHTVLFFGLIVVCLASPLIKAAYPVEFAEYFLWAIGGFVVLIIGSWVVWHGECPCTVWENRASTREGRIPYSGSCIDHYSKRWFGWTPPWWFNWVIPVIVVVIPLVVGFS